MAFGTKTFRIVCIGGSAGGLAAYSEILRGLPADTGMAFVIVPHRGLQPFGSAAASAFVCNLDAHCGSRARHEAGTEPGVCHAALC